MKEDYSNPVNKLVYHSHQSLTKTPERALEQAYQSA
jgi:hypothetical protein